MKQNRDKEFTNIKMHVFNKQDELLFFNLPEWVVPFPASSQFSNILCKNNNDHLEYKNQRKKQHQGATSIV